MDGFIILDKDSGLFSRTAGWHIAKIFGEKKFGHIGTLDPMASGVLPIAIGNATKMIPFIEEHQENKKEYLFGLRFGIETDSLDITGKIVKKAGKKPSDSKIIEACKKLTGNIEQIPPNFSAVHVNGKRAYELARSGEQIEIKSRPIVIYELEFTGKTDDNFNFRVICSRGTYVRSIVRDIAKICDTTATTTYIRRTKTNGFDVKNAVKLDFLENLVNNSDAVMKYLMAPDCALGDIPVINLDDKDTAFYKNGGFIKTDKTYEKVRVYNNKTFIGIGCVKNGMLCPIRTL
ncbi:MAG: tRNA pseudouridine(55) synthase TruB [Alphaproteobacteria bacterium]|nr:tRNA pseudouridine(55) synthase TruB [Alphaproteobacteria bacterium]